MEIDNSNICKTKFLPSIEMPMKLKNYHKNQPILHSAPYNFLIFLDTQLDEPERPFVIFWVMAF